MAKEVQVEEVQRTRRRKVKEPVMTETILGVLAVACLMIAALLLFSMVHAGGKGGEILFNGISSLIGVYVYFTPLIFLCAAYYLWKEEMPELRPLTMVGGFFLVLGVGSLGTILFGQVFGGWLGSVIANPLVANFAKVPSAFLLFGISLIGAIIFLERKPSLDPAARLLSFLSSNIFSLLKNKKTRSFDDTDTKEEAAELVASVTENESVVAEELMEEAVLEEQDDDLRKELFGELSVEEEKKLLMRPKKEIKAKPIILTPEFVPPPLDLLNLDSGKSGAGDSKSKMETIKRTLAHFRINVEMGEVTVGPTVTQFTLKPAQGVNLSKIVALHDNLAMELGSEFLRIEAPIPGKTLVGVEVPNERKATLGLRSMLELEEFTNSGPLFLAIGKNILGKPVFGDLEKMPHLLVAGATRTGKSVTLQNLIISMLYKNSPYDLKLIILDPKRVEFSSYHNLPHLYTPVIKEPKGAIKALNWAIQEMERRYEILAEHGQVNVSDYNKKVLAPALEKARKKSQVGDQITGLPPKLPYVVIIFDEYNDFMLSYPKEISPLITSLTQKGRAAGIHLILATQRPDVKVITGTIKANIPARIALKTTSQIDSRTILDASGAEDLLGNGDMLYMASDNPRLIRIQAPFISMEEIKAVVSHIKDANLDFIPEHIDISKIKTTSSSGGGNEEGGSPGEEPESDEDYMSAKDYVIATGKASTSALQTAFRWGYNKAARIMNDLEHFEVIGPARTGERYREILAGKTTDTKSEDTVTLGEGESKRDMSTDDLFR
ncbi:MAG: DNA translocase FtsK [Candidatus Pacebacteria bacterium]|nr:DNA translocase FtsK [Candidatus Paceibacterota bacterium]